MSCSWQRTGLIAALAFLGILFLSAAGGTADKQTLTGEVSDSICGAQHMQGSPAECTRACVGHGSKYMLVVGDKVYSLNTSDKGLLSVLHEQAGKKVTVTGTVNGVGVEVSSVVAAR